jgi:hypothetical protein
MDTIRSSETSVLRRAILRNIPEGGILHLENVYLENLEDDGKITLKWRLGTVVECER